MHRLALAIALVSAAMTAGSMRGSAQAGNPVVEIETSLGTITAELFMDKAPISVENFLGYVKEGFYDGVIFHRVIKSFMIQGGAFRPDMTQKQGKPPIKNEASNGLSNERGTLAMARLPQPDTASAQFFINTVDNPALNHRSTRPDEYGYAVFGRVVSGLDVVDKIASVPTGSRGSFRDVPNEPVLIKTVRVKTP